MRRGLMLSVLALAGCAWEPGQGFAVLEPTVSAAWVALPDRAADSGYQRLASDYQVRVQAAGMSLGLIELLSSASGGTAGFDPSHPPPGYSLCHGGHCHRDDGALVPYEEVAAQTGGGVAARTVASLPVGSVDLLVAPTQAVPCVPDCALPETTLARGRWPVQALQLEGTVRDGRTPARIAGTRRFRLVLEPSAGGQALAVPEGELEVPSDRSHPPHVQLALRLEVTAALFDAVDWSATTEDGAGVVDLSAPANAAAKAAVLERLAQLEPRAEVKRAER